MTDLRDAASVTKKTAGCLFTNFEDVRVSNDFILTTSLSYLLMKIGPSAENSLALHTSCECDSVQKMVNFNALRL